MKKILSTLVFLIIVAIAVPLLVFLISAIVCLSPVLLIGYIAKLIIDNNNDKATKRLKMEYKLSPKPLI